MLSAERQPNCSCVTGQVVFAPIVHGHPLVGHGLPTEWPFWERFDREHLRRCDELVVLTLDGWRDSVGVAAEIRIAGELGKPVRYLGPEDGHGSPTLARVATEGEGLNVRPEPTREPPTRWRRGAFDANRVGVSRRVGEPATRPTAPAFRDPRRYRSISASVACRTVRMLIGTSRP